MALRRTFGALLEKAGGDCAGYSAKICYPRDLILTRKRKTRRLFGPSSKFAMSLKSMLVAAMARWRCMKVTIKYFQNPALLFLMRIGLIKAAYFPYQIRKDGHNYCLLGRPVASSGGDFSVLREVLTEEIYQGILELLPKEPIRAVDIGTNIGAFTVWLHAQHSVKEVFCFEPDADCFNLCQFNISQNGCDKVSLYQQAVGGTVRETEMWVVPNRPAQSSLYQRPNASLRPQKIQVVGFNEWLEGMPGTFDLLKIDCEGAEWEILDATPTAFTRFSIIVAEVHIDPNGRHCVGDFPVILAQHGFTTVRWDAHSYGLYVGRRSGVVDRDQSVGLKSFRLEAVR